MAGLDQYMEKFRRLGIFAGVVLFFAPGANASFFEGELSSPSSIFSLLSPNQDIEIEFGIEYSHSSLPVVRNVVTENSSTSTALGPGQTKSGDVQSDYPDTVAQVFKFQAMLNREHRFTVAAKTFLPLNGIANIDTGNTYQPEFVLYRAETQRPRILLTSGIDLGPEWRVGLGLDVAFSVSAQAQVFLQSGAGTVSDQRISAKVKPGFVPQASIAFHEFALTVRGENRADFDLTTMAGGSVFSNVGAGIDFSYAAQSALFFQPWQFELTGQSDLSPSLLLKYGVSYELWGGFKTRAAVVDSCPSGPTNCTSQFSSGQAPQYRARNIFVPEVGINWSAFESASFLEFEYQFKDSIFKGTPSGVGNYLDPPRHDFKLGYTHLTQAGWQWNIHGTVSRLTSQTVVKLDPKSIGGPGYSVDGWLYGGGLSVAIPFKD